jgi:hypothetical protein
MKEAMDAYDVAVVGVFTSGAALV